MANNIPTVPSSGIKIVARDGTITDFQLSVIYEKPISVWLAENLMATVAELTEVAGGTAIYIIGQRNIMDDYDATSTPDNVYSNRKIILINYRKAMKFSFETLDFQQLGANFAEDKGVTVAEAVMTNVIRAAQISTIAYINAKIIEARINVTKGVAEQNFDLPILNADGSLYVPTTPQINTYLQTQIIIPINILIAKLTQLITLEYVGVDRGKLQVQVSPKLWVLLSSSLVTVGSDKGYTQITNLKFTEIGGVRYIENILLGTKHDIKMIDRKESFDFTDVHILVYHQDALAFPMIPKKTFQTVAPNSANPNFIVKLVVPGNDNSATPKPQNLALYPRLFLTGNLTTRPTKVKESTDLEKQVKNLEKQINFLLAFNKKGKD